MVRVGQAGGPRGGGWSFPNRDNWAGSGGPLPVFFPPRVARDSVQVLSPQAPEQRLIATCPKALMQVPRVRGAGGPGWRSHGLADVTFHPFTGGDRERSTSDENP